MAVCSFISSFAIDKKGIKAMSQMSSKGKEITTIQISLLDLFELLELKLFIAYLSWFVHSKQI